MKLLRNMYNYIFMVKYVKIFNIKCSSLFIINHLKRIQIYHFPKFNYLVRVVTVEICWYLHINWSPIILINRM